MLPNVKYELFELERLIASGDGERSDNDIADPSLSSKITTETSRIKQKFIDEVFSFEDERHLERYIQYHQQAIIGLMDKVALFLHTDVLIQPARKAFYSMVYPALEELLTFIERHFTKYFDQDAKAPEGYVSIARKDAKAGIKKIQKEFEGKAEPRLLALLLHVLEKIRDSSPGQRITYRRILYAKEVQKELYRLAGSSTDSKDVNEELRQIMYYLNYNAVKVLTYHAHYFTALLDAAETRTDKIEKLSFALKLINQSQVKPGVRYNQNSLPLKDQLTNYIVEEINYQERLQQLSGSPPDKSNDSFMPGFKLKFEASVSQLACLLRIFIETKLIQNNNLTQIMQFLVKFVITKRSETISFGSLRSKFYNVERGTKDSVRSMLLSMVNYLEKNY